MPTGGSGEGAKPGGCDGSAFIPSFLPSLGSLQLCISFDETEATVKLPEAEFKFPNRLGIEKIEYLAVEGDFKIKAIKFS